LLEYAFDEDGELNLSLQPWQAISNETGGRPPSRDRRIDSENEN
jgi:hypothetical protein